MCTNTCSNGDGIDREETNILISVYELATCHELSGGADTPCRKNLEI